MVEHKPKHHTLHFLRLMTRVATLKLTVATTTVELTTLRPPPAADLCPTGTGAGAVLPFTSPPPWLLSSLLANSSSPAAKKVLPAALTDTVAWNRCEEVCHHRPRSPPLRCLFWMPGDIDVDLADCWMKRRQTDTPRACPSVTEPHNNTFVVLPRGTKKETKTASLRRAS